MNQTRSSPVNERPGVISSYQMESLYRGVEGSLGVGLLFPTAVEKETVVEVSTLTQLGEYFPGAEASLFTAASILFQNGVQRLFLSCFASENGEEGEDAAAIDRLCDRGEVGLIVCGEMETAALSYLRQRLHSDSLLQREKVALCHQSDPDKAITLAASLNSERMMVCAGAGRVGEKEDGFYTTCAMAGLLACTGDPSANLNGSVLTGIEGLKTQYAESDIQRMLAYGVTPFETVGGKVECIKPVSTRTTTDGAPDRTWHSINTVMTIDFCMRRLRDMLKVRLKGAKNNLATRESIRSQVSVELSSLCGQGILDDFGPVRAYPSESDPGVCLVELSFKVSGVMDRIHVAAHITI